MTNGEILEKLFPGFEEIQVFSEYILRNGKETIIKVDREFWESEMREATQEEREGVEQYINSIAVPCEDCISRETAICLADELKDDLPDDDRLSDMVMSHNEGILEYQTKLSLLPSVTPAEKVGRLVDTGDGYSVECSECGKWFYHEYLAKIEIKYCPNCGIRMAESEGKE